MVGTIEVMRRVAELDRDNADLFDIADEGVFSKLEILEQGVRKEEATETVLFAEASLLLRGEYYDIEERILDVERKQVDGKIGRVETSLANLILKAPIGGMIVYKKNWRGNTVGVGDTLWPGNVVMSWNIYNGGIDTANRQEQIRRVDEERMKLHRITREVEESVRLSWHRRDEQRRRLAELRRQHNAILQLISSYSEQFKIGQRSLLDLLDTQNTRVADVGFIIEYPIQGDRPTGRGSGGSRRDWAACRRCLRSAPRGGRT